MPSGKINGNEGETDRIQILTALAESMNDETLDASLLFIVQNIKEKRKRNHFGVGSALVVAYALGRWLQDDENYRLALHLARERR